MSMRQAYLVAAVLLQQLTQQLIMHGQCASHDRLIPAPLASSVLTKAVKVTGQTQSSCFGFAANTTLSEAFSITVTFGPVCEQC